jgi:hypothetical protein
MEFIPPISWDLIYGILIVSTFCIASIASIKNIILAILYGPKFKSFSTKHKLKEQLKPIFTFGTYILGGVIGYYLFPFAMPTKVLVGCISGYFSPIIYRVFLKGLFQKLDIDGSSELDLNLDDQSGKIDTSMHVNKSSKEEDK